MSKEPKVGQLCLFCGYKPLSIDEGYVGVLEDVIHSHKVLYRLGKTDFEYCRPLTKKEIKQFMEMCDE